MDRRFVIAAASAAVVVVAAVPRGDAQRAQAEPPAAAAQAEATAPVIASGPSGRVALNGPWILRGDREQRGSLKGWQAGAFRGSTVKVPNSPNAERITGRAGIRSFAGSLGWYRTSFTVPADGDYAIRLESVNHRSAVWVDGRLRRTHTGEYLPFEVELPLKAGAHELVVRADWRNPAAMKRQAWHRTWFNFGGINREVTIRRVGGSVLSIPSVRTRLQRDGSALVDVTVHVRNRTGVAREVPVGASLSHGEQALRLDLAPVALEPGQTGVARGTFRVARPELWAPGSPALYDLRFEVPGESDFSLRTGLRTIAARNGRLLLNGRPIVLKGASIHEDAPGRGDAITAADMDEVVRQLQAIGANATRAQHPLHPALLERLDAAGIMVWQGIGPVDAPGAWTSKTPALRRQSSERVRRNLQQLQPHPSIITWNLANEIAGNGHPDGQAPWMRRTVREVKRRDPSRPVALDVWGAHPPKQMGAVYRDVDLIGDTNYIGWYEATFASPAEHRRLLREHIAEFRRVFRGKVLVVTEFGAEANRLNGPNEPGGTRFQSAYLRRHIETYASIPYVQGMLVWNIRDFAVAPTFAGGSIRKQVPDIRLVRGLNQKGLFTYDNRPKPSVTAVREALAAVGR